MSDLALLENWANNRDSCLLDYGKEYYADYRKNGNVEVFYSASHILYGVRLPSGQCIIRDIRCSSFKDEYTDHLEKFDNVITMHHVLFDQIEMLPDAYDIPF